MKVLLVLCASLSLTLIQIRTAIAQRLQTVRPDKPVICYHNFENRPDHIGVSEKFRLQRQRATGRNKTANIEVEYINFPSDGVAKNAFQYAVAIWESELTSSVPIRIHADWRQLASGVLGQAVWGTAYANFGGEQHMNVYYPVALAEKISGKELNPSDEPDIIASFNSTVAWYLGTDGETPTGKMDLVTIVLHEIAHGLGFTDTYDVANKQGSVGFSSGGTPVPFIYDVFVGNDQSQKLLNDFSSPSAELANELQSADLFFDGPMAVASLNGDKPELYAPATFDDGSSISHLDESTFNGQQDANRLMTPQISFAESIHEPGTVLLGTLADMGWTYTYIDHTPLKDTERTDGQPYTVTAVIRSDNGFNPASVKLHYTIDGANFTVVNMTGTGEPGQFQGSLPGRTTEWAYAYYISVNDADARTFTSPGKLQTAGEQPEQATHFFRIGPDLQSPEISHEPVAFLPEGSTQLTLSAEITDNQGVKEAIVEYSLNEGQLQTAVMNNDGTTDNFTVAINLPALSMEEQLKYRITATDQASAQNVTTDPGSDFFVVHITGIKPVQDFYSNDFNKASTDFFGANFRIETPAGFQNDAIHSDHPYKNGSGPGNESNYSYQLQIPIRLGATNPFIKFDEIVLVEPGEDGSVFGGDNFFDYVIVEGSVDKGVTWEPFGPGYDSRSVSAWLDRYNSDIVEDNSEAVGQPALFRQRSINLLENGNFFEGDEVLFRFRLFADQLAHGWGWAIDNLSIQAPITGVERPFTQVLKVYPVPAATDLFVEFEDLAEGPLHIQISDALGRIVHDGTLDDNDGKLSAKIDVRTFDNGFYVLKARGVKTLITRKFLKQAR